MPIPLITVYTGDYPDLADPINFDTDMTNFGAWFVPSVPELNASIVAMNTALNDNGTVLDATAEATRRATNAVVPETTTGTGAAYVVSAAVTIPAFALDEPVAFRAHVINSGAATLNVDGTGAIEIRQADGAGNLVPLSGGEFSAYSENIVVSNGTYWVLVTQPLRELIAGPVLSPLPAQDDDFDDLVEGGEYIVDGNWSNGPLGAGIIDYTAENATAKVVNRDGLFIRQEVTIENGTSRFTRVRSGDPLVWGSWSQERRAWEAVEILTMTGSTVETSDFEAGYDYRFLLDGVSHNAASEEFTVAFFEENAGGYTSQSPFTDATGGGGRLSGEYIFREPMTPEIVHQFGGFAAQTASTGRAFFNIAAGRFGVVSRNLSAETVRRLRFGVNNAGAFDSGTIVVQRK